MGKKKPKNKGDASQEQQKVPAPQQTPQPPPSAQPTAGSSGSSQTASSKDTVGKKQQQPPQPTSTKVEPGLSQQPSQSGKGQKQKKQTEQKPAQGAWQQGGPQQQQQRQVVPQDGQRPLQQSTPTPQQQPIPQKPPQQQIAGRGKGRGQPQEQIPSTPHSASPSPQPGQGPWVGQQQSQQRQHPQQPQPHMVPPQYAQQPGLTPQQQQQYMYQQQQQYMMQQQQLQQQQLQQQQLQQQQFQQHQLQQQQQQMQKLQIQQQQPTGPQQPPRAPPGLVQQQHAPPQQSQVQQPQLGAPKTVWQKAPPQPSEQQSTPIQQVQPIPQQPKSSQTTRPPQDRSRSIQQGGPQKPQAKGPHEQSPPLDLVIPQRKKLKSAGTNGRKILIETNHLALILRNLNAAVHYDVAIEPDTPKKLLRSVMETFRKTYYPKRYPAFDGTKNLYSSPKLPFDNQISGDITIMEDDRAKSFNVTVKFAAMVDLSVLSRYFEGGGGGTSLSAGEGNRHMITPQEAIQCLDVVLRSAPALNCIPVGRSFFTKPRDQIIDLGDGMEMYYGFYQSAILGWKPFLNVDVAHKAFPKSLRVLEVITELCNCDLTVKLAPYNHEVVDKFLRTLKVQYEIPTHPASKRVMRVNALDKPSSEARFRTDDGKEMTVAQYFTNIKGYPLRFPNMPCLWVGSKARESKILFPAELCTVLEGQVTNRVMTPNQTSSMIRFAATSTDVRKNKIMQGIRIAQFNQDPSAKEFGISVDEKFAKVEARVLDAPSLRYASKSVRPQKGCWRADTFRDGRTLQKWAIVCLDDRTRPQVLQEFAEMMIQQGRPVGMKIEKPSNIVTPRLVRFKEKAEIEKQFASLKGMELILVVIPNEHKDMYNYVKQVSELSIGTLTQCVRARNVFRPKPATVGNILLKVNAKLNGVNHILEKRPRCLERPCMIMGADVTHPSPESRGTVPSVAAVTASHDANAFKYNISWRLQPPAQEIITDLANIVKEHLLFFYQQNKAKPERIIFFRDGVSEGQFQIVLNAEVHTIRQACTMVQKDGTYKPNITFLVVQKRHHTRFFPTNPRDSEDRNCNVPAGTIVDTEITHPTALDFYLVSHASIQGVARPTKYRMLWDDNDMNEDELEQLTYHLCHLFTRCTRSVSYPAPTYYAHLAAARAKVYCERRQVNMNDLEREQQQLIVKSDIIKGLPMFFV